MLLIYHIFSDFLAVFGAGKPAEYSFQAK